MSPYRSAMLLVVIALSVACSAGPAAPNTGAATASPTGAPFLLKSGGDTPTPLGGDLSTLAASTQVAPLPPPATPGATAFTTAATVPPTAAPTLALSAPIISRQFSLRDLPGEGRSPYSLAALGDKLYVVNVGSDNIAVLQNDRAVKYIPTGPHPGVIAADAANKRLYISLESDKAVGMLVDDTITIRQGVGDEVRALALMDNHLYVGLQDTGSVLVLDPATLKTVATISIPGALGIINLAGDPVHHRLYADIYEKITVIDSTSLKVVTTLPTKGSYYTLLAQPSGDRILINRYDDKTRSQSLIALDPNSGVERGSVPIGGDPRGAAISSDGSRVYVANSFSNNVSVVDLRGPTLIATVPVDLRPVALWLDEAAHKLYVANGDSDNLSVVNTDTNQVAAAIPLGMLPTALAANESTGRVYVANASTDSLYVLEGTRVVKEIGVGRHPVDVARDEAGNRILVANAADRTLSIVDEGDLSIHTTAPITPSLPSVAVDAARGRVFAGDMILDLKTLAPAGRLTMQGNSIGSVITPNWVRVNPNNSRIYAVGWNGTPGSNSRSVTYSVDGSTLQQRSTLAYYGNTSALAIDPDTNRVFLAGTHPLAFTNELYVFDASDAKLVSLALPARTTGMVYNPLTRHLFLAHTTNFSRSTDPTPTPADKMVQVFDANSFGEVALLTVNAPGPMARLGNMIYVASRKDGSVAIIQDAAMAIPPSPTPTFTPSPYPTLPPLTPTRAAGAVPPATLTRAVTPTALSCAVPVSPLLAQQWTPQVAARIGCPLESQRLANVAAQVFDRGTMYWREDEKRIYVLYSDKTWAVYDDKWTEQMAEDACPAVTVPAGKLKPKRGFGKLWCEQSDVRKKIGAAAHEEAGGYSSATQRFQRGQMIGTTGGALLLYGDGKWE